MKTLTCLCLAVACGFPTISFAATPSQTYSASTVAPSTTQVSLEETVKATLSQYRQLKAIQENRQASVHELRRAKAGWGPRLDVVGGVGASHLSDSTTRSYGSDTGMRQAGNVGMTLTQTLWDGFSTGSKVDIATYRLNSLDQRVLDNATMLTLEAVIAHVELERNRILLDYANKNVAQHQTILTAQQTRETMGASTLADVQQIQGRLLRAHSQQVDMQALVREAEEAYTRLTGKNPPASMQSVALPSPVYESQQSCLDMALQHNIKLLAYGEDIKMAGSERELAKASYQPVINLETGPNYSDRGGKGSQWTSSFDAMLVTRWNLFNSGADVAGVAAASARYRQIREEAMNFSDDLRQQVADTWTRYMAAQGQEQYYKKAVMYNTETRDAFFEQFRVGERSLLDVLDAASELYNSSTQRATASSNVYIAAYRMYALSGTILQLFGIEEQSLLQADGAK
ncbi:MAG: TolC family protein [Bilophila sp.]